MAFPVSYSFIKALLEPGNLFVLGAGVSAEFIKPGNDLFKKVGSLWLKGDGFSPRAGSSQIAQKILASGAFPDEHDAMIISLLSQQGGEWLVSYILSHRRRLQRFYSYEVFKYFQRPFSIINYNHDNIARVSLKGIEDVAILEPHGSIHPRLHDLLDSFEIVEIADFDLPAPNAENLIMLRREPSEFSRSPFFSILDQSRTIVNNIFFIGYSFGQRSDGYRDDQVSFEYFCDLLRGKRSFVVSPNAESIATELQENAQNSGIIPIQLRWDIFSRAVIECGIVFSKLKRTQIPEAIVALKSSYSRIEIEETSQRKQNE